MGESCDFCGNIITGTIIGKFKHYITNYNFMIGGLDGKEIMCNLCYTRAKNNPPTVREFQREELQRMEDAKKMLESHEP